MRKTFQNLIATKYPRVADMVKRYFNYQDSITLHEAANEYASQEAKNFFKYCSKNAWNITSRGNFFRAGKSPETSEWKTFDELYKQYKEGK